MDYKKGIAKLKEYLKDERKEHLIEINTLEDRLLKCEREERLFGSSENTRNVHSQVIYSLNEIALAYFGVSFNFLCLDDKIPHPVQVESADDRQTITKGTGENFKNEILYGNGNRWAVIVGVNQYDDHIHYGELHVCVRDADAVFNQLLESGYKNDHVRMLTDISSELPTRDNVLVALTAIANATEPNDTLFFFYSGHGDEDSGEAYLVGRNGKSISLEDTAIKISRIKTIMEHAPAMAKVIIIDACHSGAKIERKGPKAMTEDFIRRVFEQAEGLAILASCKQGQVSYEWREKERSVFTYYLLEALQGQADLDAKGFVTVQDINRHVSNGVRLWASQRNLNQTPTLQTEVAGDIILAQISSLISKS